VVARAVAARRLAGRDVLLDLSPVADLERRFPGTVDIARAAGLDPRGALPVTAAAHFHMGGIATDASGATSLRGLYACGEIAATGLHGGNRLASNSLLEGLVFGERIARAIRAAPLATPSADLDVPVRAGIESADASRIAALRGLFSASLGPLRQAAAMTGALARLAGSRPASRAEEDLATVARLVLACALARRESRGAHSRADFPGRDDAQALRRFIAPAAIAARPLFGIVVPPPAAIAAFAGTASHAP
jgi:L-aspartate oxidase